MTRLIAGYANNDGHHYHPSNQPGVVKRPADYRDAGIGNSDNVKKEIEGDSGNDTRNTNGPTRAVKKVKATAINVLDDAGYVGLGHLDRIGGYSMHDTSGESNNEDNTQGEQEPTEKEILEKMEEVRRDLPMTNDKLLSANGWTTNGERNQKIKDGGAAKKNQTKENNDRTTNRRNAEDAHKQMERKKNGGDYLDY